MIIPTFQSDCGRVRLYLGDGVEIAKTLEGVDAVITDPPYGMNWDTDNSRYSGGNVASVNKRGNGVGTNGGQMIVGDSEPFNPSPWIDFRNVVLFGCNHFSSRLPVGTTLVWLKRNDYAFGSFLSDAEVAWMKGGHGVYCFKDLSMSGEALSRCHPNQKPASLMQWCIDKAKVERPSTVLDPYMGSGTTGIACLRTGRNFIGIEIDPVHYKTAEDRIKRELAQLRLNL